MNLNNGKMRRESHRNKSIHEKNMGLNRFCCIVSAMFSFTATIDLLYSTVGLVVLLGYMPQIIKLMRTTTDCRDISLYAWMIWNYTAIVSLLYSVFILPDIKFMMVNGVNVLCITIIIALTAYKRWHYKSKN